MDKKSSFNFVSVRFQMITGLILTVCVIPMVFVRRFYFKPLETPPKILTVTPQKLKEFGSPNVIETGIIISDFDQFDINKNNFIFHGIIWFEFKPGTISIDNLKKFTFEKGEIISISAPETKIINDNLLVRFNISVQFSSQINYSHFPLDDHRLYLMFTHKSLMPDEFIFKSSNRQFIFNANITDDGWTLLDKKVKTGYQNIQLHTYDQDKFTEYPVVLYSMDIQRSKIRFFLSILMPLFVIIRLVIFSFSLSVKNALRLAVIAVSAALGYRFVIDRLSPKVGYFMLTDFFFFLILIISFLCFLFNIIANTTDKITSFHKQLMILFLNAFTIIISIYFLLMWS